MTSFQVALLGCMAERLKDKLLAPKENLVTKIIVSIKNAVLTC